MRSITFKLPDSEKVYTGTRVRRFPGGAFVECPELGRPISILEDPIVEK